MEKYYVPEIEEFYVGFEFEISMTSIGGLDIVDFSKDPIQVEHIAKPNTKVWEETKVFFDTSYGFNNKLFRSIEQLKEILEDGRIRVKYLDKDDIEDLGFKLKSDVYEDGSKMYFENNEGLQLSYRFYKGKDYPLIHLFDYDSKGRMNTIFSMKVKNKSKLKQLLRDKI